MIFVTVGTERFPFNRLLMAVDHLLEKLPNEAVFMQTGNSNYVPSCPYEKFISYDEFVNKVAEARIVIGHAGAGTLLMCCNHGKIPVMMPRISRLNEHVDNHQQMLASRMAERGTILLAETDAELEANVLNYDTLSLPKKAVRATTPELALHLKAYFSAPEPG